MKKLNILVITNLYPPQVIGGYERSIADYSRLLHQKGHRVIVLTSDTTSYPTNCSEVSEEPNVKRVLKLCGEWRNNAPTLYPAEMVRDIKLFNHLIISKEIQTFKPDVCLTGNIDFFELSILEKILADGIPIIHYVMNQHPGYPPELAPKTSLYRYITCSDWVKSTLTESGYPTATTQTIYPGAAVEEFYQRVLPTHDCLRIAYASLVMPYKGADVLLEALSLLHAANIPFFASIAGGSLMPEFVEELQRFAEEVEMLDKIRFTGALSREELKCLYLDHNVLVFPSRFQEPFGISQIEAMAAGLTLVTSGTGGASEIIQQRIEGLQFESENPIDLADALSYLPLNLEEWEAISRRGQSHALNNFSQHKTVEKIEAMLFEMSELNRFSQ